MSTWDPDYPPQRIIRNPRTLFGSSTDHGQIKKPRGKGTGEVTMKGVIRRLGNQTAASWHHRVATRESPKDGGPPGYKTPR